MLKADIFNTVKAVIQHCLRVQSFKVLITARLYVWGFGFHGNSNFHFNFKHRMIIIYTASVVPVSSSRCE